MKKCFVVEDTSYVVALLNAEDPNHTVATDIFTKLLELTESIKIVLPSIIIYETLFVLIKNRVPLATVQQKLWKLLMIYDVLNYPLLETTAIRVGSKMKDHILNLPTDAVLRSNDLMIVAVSVDFDHAPILTFDKKMKTTYAKLNNIYYCLDEKDRGAFFKKVTELCC